MPRDYRKQGLLGAKNRWAKEPAPEERFLRLAEVGFSDQCWPWKGSATNAGYGKRKFRGKTVSAHRVAWIMFRGEIPEGLCVLHTCDNRICVNPNHLWLGTKADNNRDRHRKGRDNPPRGERQPMCKLSEADVHRIRNLIKEGKTQREIAETFDVSHSAIYAINKRHSWRHI